MNHGKAFVNLNKNGIEHKINLVYEHYLNTGRVKYI